MEVFIMTVQQRIMAIRLMDEMERQGMKEEDGTCRMRNEKGKVLVEAKMVEKKA